MNVRNAVPADRPAIRDVARRSIEASYSLDTAAIIEAIEEWYGEQSLAETLEDDQSLLLAVEADHQVVAFSESEYSDSGEGTLLWLHVDPAYRDTGIGSQLLEETKRRLDTAGVRHLNARVLADNDTGNDFYRDLGFEKVAEESIDIAGQTYLENHYVEGSQIGITPLALADGTTVFVNYGEAETGSLDAFHTVYDDADATDLHGYFCSNCEDLANAMDAMGRIECNNCGNVRKPTRWDAAYL